MVEERLLLSGTAGYVMPGRPLMRFREAAYSGRHYWRSVSLLGLFTQE